MEMPTTGRRTWLLNRFEWLVFVAIAAAIIIQLFVPPIVGVADNGDYDRVLGPLGLEPTVTEWSDRYFDHLNLDYRTAPVAEGLFPTSQIWLGKAALAVNGLVSGDGSFRITTLGAINAAISRSL